MDKETEEALAREIEAIEQERLRSRDYSRRRYEEQGKTPVKRVGEGRKARSPKKKLLSVYEDDEFDRLVENALKYESRYSH